MTAAVDAASISAEVGELPKATAVLACIQCAAEYCNEGEVDLADAVSVVRALVVTASARIDAVLLNNSTIETKGEGPS